MPAPASGTITKILKQPDEDVKVGEVLAQLEPGEACRGDGNGAGNLVAAEARERRPGPGQDDAPSEGPRPRGRGEPRDPPQTRPPPEAKLGEAAGVS